MTGYGLDGPGIESRCGRDFPHLSRPALLYNGYRVFPGDKERPGRDADPSPPSSTVGHETVELYLYSPYGPYGQYRASVPVQGCTLQVFIGFSSGFNCGLGWGSRLLWCLLILSWMASLT